MIDIGISRIAFSIGPVSVGWYGIMIALAVMTVVGWVLHEVKRGANLSTDTVINAALVGIPSGIIISRLLHVIDLWSYYSQNPGQIVGGAGLSIYGAVLGATLGVWIYSKVKKITFGYLADLTAPGIILAQAIGRVGCTLNGCCYGVPTDAAYGIIYTNPDSFAPVGIAVHPAHLYLLLWNLAVFAVLWKLRKRLQLRGSLFLVYLALYSAGDFAIRLLREGEPFLAGLYQAQAIGLAILAVTVPWLIIRMHRAKRATLSTRLQQNPAD